MAPARSLLYEWPPQRRAIVSIPARAAASTSYGVSPIITVASGRRIARRGGSAASTIYGTGLEVLRVVARRAPRNQVGHSGLLQAGPSISSFFGRGGDDDRTSRLISSCDSTERSGCPRGRGSRGRRSANSCLLANEAPRVPSGESSSRLNEGRQQFVAAHSDEGHVPPRRCEPSLRARSAPAPTSRHARRCCR